MIAISQDGLSTLRKTGKKYIYEDIVNGSKTVSYSHKQSFKKIKKILFSLEDTKIYTLHHRKRISVWDTEEVPKTFLFPYLLRVYNELSSFPIAFLKGNTPSFASPWALRAVSSNGIWAIRQSVTQTIELLNLKNTANCCIPS